jgi:hypothetical protein
VSRILYSMIDGGRCLASLGNDQSHLQVKFDGQLRLLSLSNRVTDQEWAPDRSRRNVNKGRDSWRCMLNLR